MEFILPRGGIILAGVREKRGDESLLRGRAYADFITTIAMPFKRLHLARLIRLAMSLALVHGEPHLARAGVDLGHLIRPPVIELDAVGVVMRKRPARRVEGREAVHERALVRVRAAELLERRRDGRDGRAELARRRGGRRRRPLWRGARRARRPHRYPPPGGGGRRREG